MWESKNGSDWWSPGTRLENGVSTSEFGQDAEKVGNGASTRRFIISAGLGGMLMSASAEADVMHQGGPGVDGGQHRGQQHLLERLAVVDLISRERSARDAGQWADMAACYHPASVVEVAWFKGSGADFVKKTEEHASNGGLNFHILGQSAVKLNKRRATAETTCQIIGIAPLDGVEVILVSYPRLMWRFQMSGDQFLIAGLRVIYIRDTMIPADPTKVPAIDEAELARYRLSYRFESYLFARGQHPARDDLPGHDRPETVTALRQDEALWLAAA